VYRYFPLPMHHQAVPAIRASECAADQGRFEAFHDALFADQDSVVAGSWEYIAHLADVHDLRLFDKCVAATGPIPALARDTLAARRLHVDATPTFLINETRLEGAQPLDTLELYIRRALQDGASPQR
jgi:protein-disulfide isomerase